MRLSRLILIPGLFLVAALAAFLAAWLAVDGIETSSKDGVSRQLVLQGHEWVTVETNGLQVRLSGTAADEATRFRALSIAGTVVDATRVIDQMQVRETAAIKPPRFSVEILRNDAGISLIGLIPAATDRAALTATISKIAGDAHVTDLLEAADYPVEENWDQALTYALDALATLPRSKISVDAHRVAITAISDSIKQKRNLEVSLSNAVPEGLTLSLNITAPRPVITPYTLRFLIDESGARFDACTAHTDAGRTRIIAAATAAGVSGKISCTLGLGVPSPDWPDAVVVAIAAVKALGSGSVTFSDADVTLVASENTPQDVFDRVVGELEADLPEVFSLHSVLPEPVKIDGTGEGSGPPEFIATRSPEGLVQLRGRLTDERQRSATESFARAQFGVGSVYAATRLDPELPDGWSTRVLAALEALSFLSKGVVVVQPDIVDIRGDTGLSDANAEIARILSEKLGEAENYQVNVIYHEDLDPEAALPTPQECVEDVNAVLAETKIAFAPGSANIDGEARATIDKIAEILKTCPDVQMEIGGHTDSQGREEMNLSLSQNRAQAVLNALLARRILTSNLSARGYGEAVPVADNDSEEGREANRRIEFRLILPDGTPAAEADETAADQSDAEASDGETPAEPAPDPEATEQPDEQN